MSNTQQTPTPSTVSFRQLAMALALADKDNVVATAMHAVEEWHPHSNLLGAKKLLVEAAVEIALSEFGPEIALHPSKLFQKFDLETLVQEVYGSKRHGMPYERSKAYLRRIGVIIKENVSEKIVIDQHELIKDCVMECFKS
jgi:hypothetical protein